MVRKTGKKSSDDLGEVLITTIEAELKNCGFKPVSSEENNKFKVLANKLYSCDTKLGTTILKGEYNVDFLLNCPEHTFKKLAIKIKVKTTGGTTYNMLPFDIHNINRNKIETVLVLAGDKYSPGSLEWINEQIHHEQLLNNVFRTSKEVIHFINDNFGDD